MANAYGGSNPSLPTISESPIDTQKVWGWVAATKLVSNLGQLVLLFGLVLLEVSCCAFPGNVPRLTELTPELVKRLDYVLDALYPCDPDQKLENHDSVDTLDNAYDRFLHDKALKSFDLKRFRAQVEYRGYFIFYDPKLPFDVFDTFFVIKKGGWAFRVCRMNT